jgi:hypothetical protein
MRRRPAGVSAVLRRCRAMRLPYHLTVPVAGAATGLRSTVGMAAMLVASTTGLASAKVGHDHRVAGAKRFPPLAVAVAEDAVAVGVAATSARA